MIMAHALCMLAKSTGTHSENVIRLAFPQQVWLRKTRLNVTFIRTLPVLFKRGTEQRASRNAPSEVK